MMDMQFVVPHHDDGTSWYRGIGVLSDMRHRFRIKQMQDVAWSTMYMADVVFMQRPFRQVDVEIMEAAKRYGCKLWVDYDDYLPGVDNHNPRADIYGKKFEPLWNSFLDMADLITCSTQPLFELVDRVEKSIVTRNTFPARSFYRYMREPVHAERDIVFWRGGKSHYIDWLKYRQAQADVDLGDWEMHMFGQVSSRVEKTLPITKMHEPLSVTKFFDYVRWLRPKVTIVPLVDSPFNRAKSDIAWLENVILAGGITVAPSLPEWLDHPACVYYTGPEDYTEAVETAMQMSDEERKKQVEMAWEYVLDCRRPEVRAEAICEAIDLIG